VPSPVGGLGLAPRKKNQFCAKTYAILSKFWYFFPILQHKVEGLSPVLKVGDLSPVPPPAPTPMTSTQLITKSGATSLPDKSAG